MASSSPWNWPTCRVKNHTYEHYLGVRALRRFGRKKWRKYVAFGAERLIEALHPDDVVIGGGNARHLKKLPERLPVGRQRAGLPRRLPPVGRRAGATTAVALPGPSTVVTNPVFARTP